MLCGILSRTTWNTAPSFCRLVADARMVQIAPSPLCLDLRRSLEVEVATSMSCLFWGVVNLIPATTALSRALFMMSRRRRELMCLRMGVPSLVMVRDWSRFRGMAGEVVVGLEDLGDGTFADICLGIAGGGGALAGRPGGPTAGAGGGGGVAAVWNMLRRVSLSSSANLVATVASLSTRAGSFWYLVSGGGGWWRWVLRSSQAS